MLFLDPVRFVEVTELSEAARFELRTVFIFLIGFLFVFQFLLGQAMTYYRTWILQRVNQDLRVAMMTNAVQVSLRYHNNNQVGDAIYRVYQDSAMVTAVIQNGLIQPVILVGSLCIALVVLLGFNVYLALLFLLAVAPTIGIAYLATKTLRKRSLAARTSNSDLTSHIQESVQGTKLLQALNAESRAFDEFVTKSKTALDRAYELRRTVTLLGLAVFFCTAVIVLFADYVMVQLIWSGTETFGYGVLAFVGFATWTLGAFNAAREQTGGASGSLVGLVQTWSLLQDMGVGLQRAMFLLQYQPEIRDKPTTIPFPRGPVSVNFNSVSFEYESGHSVLRDVSFGAEPGTLSAIVGGSGAGKSTLMSLLLRLYDVDDGEISIQDIDIRDFKQNELRTNISIVLQENALFPTTIAENIRFAAPTASERDVQRATYTSCVDEFLSDLPEGLETELGERGAKLSTGQRQRISIARAVLKDARILVLDEPTASLDLKTERTVLERIREQSQNKVVFLITHRVATTAQADQVVFIEDGVSAEVGSPANLLRLNNGRYRRFVEAETSSSETA